MILMYYWYLKNNNVIINWRFGYFYHTIYVILYYKDNGKGYFEKKQFNTFFRHWYLIFACML